MSGFFFLQQAYDNSIIRKLEDVATVNVGATVISVEDVQ